MRGLEGRAFVVTGGSTIIGQAVVRELHGGASVTGADWAVDGGYSAMGPEQAVPAIPQLME